VGTVVLEGLAEGTKRKGARVAEKKERERGPGKRLGAWRILELRLRDSLMKADTGRILRQRFCFLMAMVSCRNRIKSGARAHIPVPHLEPPTLHKVFPVESIPPPSPPGAE
jgi:hypothetical protein